MHKKQNRLTLTEVAKELDVSVSTVWRWVTKGVKSRTLKSRMVGGRRFVDRRSLSAFLKTDSDLSRCMSHEEAERALSADDI